MSTGAPLRLVVTGGGTGGHIYPALAVARAAQCSTGGADVLYVGGTGGMEADIVPPTGLAFHGIATRKLRKLASPDTVLVALALYRGYREATARLRAFRPHVVVGTGGYVAAAAVLAAQRRGIPTIVLAPDAVPGRTNRLLARRASHICVMFEEMLRAFRPDRTVLTGLPIRSDVVSPESQAAARRGLGLTEDAFTVYVQGGSQGAQRLNEIVPQAARALHGPVQVLHQVGPRNFAGAMAQGWDEGGVRWVPRPYLDARELPLAYRAADLVVCRTGVSTLAEVTANGLPAVMVPLPTAYADHQSANARAIERGGGGILMPQSMLTPEALAAQIEALRSDPARLAALAAGSRAMGRPDAAAAVVGLARELAG